MQTEELWARAQTIFSTRTDADMKAHAEGVLRWASELLRQGEPGRPEVVTPAAVLHDVGIPRAIQLYGSSSPPGQEVEGAVIARDILAELGCTPQHLEAICGIIAVHHHRPAHPTDEFRVIYDADLLVNAQESGWTREQVVDRLYTASARRLSRELLPSSQSSASLS